jgi:hypothetical protein
MSASRCVVLAIAIAAITAIAAGAGADARAPASSRTAAAAPTVQSMVVGIGGKLLSPARAIAASASTVRVGRKSCAVAAGTPLAVLAALQHAGGPRFALRDYGHCGSSPRDSAELFLDSLGGESNSGQNGWEYKVDGLAGSAGAADPSGPTGNGRLLRSGQRVLWFWCVSSASGCERTLEASVSPASVAPGGAITVSVRGYDDEGHAAAVSDALVTIAGSHSNSGAPSASTGSDGTVALTAPTTPGRYELTATRSGLVPSFPQAVVVR